MPRQRLGDTRVTGATYVDGITRGATGLHALRLDGRPFLAVVSDMRDGEDGAIEFAALTVAPNGSPDLVGSVVLPPVSPASVAAALVEACRRGSAHHEEVARTVSWLTTVPPPGEDEPHVLAGALGLMRAAGFEARFVDAMEALTVSGAPGKEFRRALFDGTDAFRAACIAHPLVAEARWHDAVERGGDPLEAMRADPEDDTPTLSQALLRRLAGLNSDDFFPGRKFRPVEALLHLLATVPPEWVPTEGEERVAAAQVSVAAAHAEQATGTATWELVAPSKGDWVAFAARCTGAAAGRDIVRACEDLGDFPRFLRDRLVLPLMARAGNPDAAIATRVAVDWAYAGKSLPGALEASASWHANHDACLAALPDAADADEAWPTPFEAAAVGGLSFVPLVTGRALQEEGASGPDGAGVPGLRHCVGSYRAEARSGARHVVSVRRMRGPSYERLATLELALQEDGPAEVVQLRGLRNADPPPGVAEAAAAYAARPRRAMPVRREAGVDPFRGACGYDWRDDAAFASALEVLRPLLPRRLRALGELELAGLADVPPVDVPELW